MWLDFLILTNLHWSAIPFQWERVSVGQGHRFRGAVHAAHAEAWWVLLVGLS